jgi:tRNA A37 threonylcarbamoyladenosine dehydratase
MEMNEIHQIEHENQLRFGGIARLYGLKGASTLEQSHVMIIGLGGVGSWAVESLARSGVGTLSLVDLDDICITNTNRQLHATKENIGQSKAIILKKRILSINPNCQVILYNDFFTEKTADLILEKKVDFVLDAIDSLKNKVLLITECRKREIPFIITGGAAGKIDPTKIVIQDLGESINDSLLFRVRKLLRKNDVFPKGEKFSVKKKQKFNIPCVYSPEDVLYPTANGEVCLTPDSENSATLDCETGMGSVSHITALYGFMAAGFIVNSLVKKSKLH